MMRVFVPVLMVLLSLPEGEGESTRAYSRDGYTDSYSSVRDSFGSQSTKDTAAGDTRYDTLAQFSAFMTSSQTTTTTTEDIITIATEAATTESATSEATTSGTAPSDATSAATDPAISGTTGTTEATQPTMSEEFEDCLERQRTGENVEDLASCERVKQVSKARGPEVIFCTLSLPESSLAQQAIEVESMACAQNGELLLDDNGGRTRRGRQLRHVQGMRDPKRFRGAVFQKEDELIQSVMHKSVVIELEFPQDCHCYAKMDPDGFTAVCPKTDVCQKVLSSVAI